MTLDVLLKMKETPLTFLSVRRNFNFYVHLGILTVILVYSSHLSEDCLCWNGHLLSSPNSKQKFA